jgi:hypothetical protein
MEEPATVELPVTRRMPTVLPEGPYRVHFYAQDRLQEPPHVHVQRDRNEAKFWLDPVRLERGGGFPRHELRDVRRLLETHERDLPDAWNAYS